MQLIFSKINKNYDFVYDHSFFLSTQEYDHLILFRKFNLFFSKIFNKFYFFLDEFVDVILLYK